MILHIKVLFGFTNQPSRGRFSFILNGHSSISIYINSLKKRPWRKSIFDLDCFSFRSTINFVPRIDTYSEFLWPKWLISNLFYVTKFNRKFLCLLNFRGLHGNPPEQKYLFFFLIAVGQEVANYSISNSLGGGVLFIWAHKFLEKKNHGTKTLLTLGTILWRNKFFQVISAGHYKKMLRKTECT